MRSQLPVDPGRSPHHTARWRDPGLPAQERAKALIPLMTLPEKVAQLVGVWVGHQRGLLSRASVRPVHPPHPGGR
jgi:beta-xylosidase